MSLFGGSQKVDLMTRAFEAHSIEYSCRNFDILFV